MPDTPKRRGYAFTHIRDTKWREALIEATAAFEALPPTFREVWVKLFDQVMAEAEAAEVPPQQLAVLMSVSMGGLCLVTLDGDAMNDREVDAFIKHCHASIHIGVARARIASGWTPGGRH
jgi:hypothetical protein